MAGLAVDESHSRAETGAGVQFYQLGRRGPANAAALLLLPFPAKQGIEPFAGAAFG